MSKTLIVTGGSRGIGAEIAHRATKAGYAICLTYHSNVEAADKVVQSILSEGGTALAVKANVAQESDILNVFKAVDDQLPPLAALINNAGILEMHTSVEQMTFERL